MTLPNADRAVIDPAKLAGYCLSADHPVGKHKAAVFRSALGLTAADTFVFAGLIRDGTHIHTATPGVQDEFGARHQVDMILSTAVGTATVRTAWIVRTGEDFPRLVTRYIVRGRAGDESPD